MDDRYNLKDSAIKLMQLRDFNVHNFIETNRYTMSINTETAPLSGGNSLTDVHA
jgi:hypothetical protein